MPDMDKVLPVGDEEIASVRDRLAASTNLSAHDKQLAGFLALIDQLKGERRA